MANYTTSPNMNLTVPTVSLDPGPDWAQNLNTSLAAIDSHDHSGGKGVTVTPSGLNINADLPFNANNLISARSVRLFTNVVQPVLATDLGCLYRFGTDLYFNDGDGNQIRMTQSGSVSGSSGTITGLPSGTASAAFSAVSGTFIFQQATSTAANLDVGSIIVRYPGSYPTPSGNYIAIEAPSSLASGYVLTLPAIPAQTNVMTLDTSGNISSTTWNAVANNRTRASGSTVAVGGVAVSASSASFTTSSTSAVAVTNLSVTITTSGRPVQLQIVNDGLGSGTQWGTSNFSGASCSGLYRYVRGSTTISIYNSQGSAIGATVSDFIAPATMLDVVAAGTYTYTVQVNVSPGGSTFSATNAVLVAYEI